MSASHDLLMTIADLGDGERRVLLTLARRLLLGQRTYGRIDLRADGRDWRRERAEELADALIYGAFAEVAAAAEGPQPDFLRSRKEKTGNGDMKEKDR